VKALIVGLGSIGRRHGRNLRALSVDVIGFDPDGARRDAFATEVAGSLVCRTLEDGLDAGCDFAVIASPNAFHIEQALACARHDLDLFIEKPLGVDASGVTELVAEVGERRLVALLGSNWKFHPSLMRLKEIVDRGDIGTILAVQALGGQYLPDWHPWEDYRRMYSSRKDLGGGVLFDCHDLDYLTWLLGPLASIGCRMVSTGTLDIETTDLACVMLMFTSGAVGTLQLDYLQRPYARRVHLTGSEGTAIWDYADGLVREYQAATTAWTESRPPEGYDLNAMYVDEMRHFLRCVDERRPTVTPLAQAIHVLAAFERACASSQAGGVLTAVA
jgi:predicted dehydrogenase